MGKGHLDGNCAVAGSFETRRSTHSLLFVLAHDARPHDEFHHLLQLGLVMVAADRVQVDEVDLPLWSVVEQIAPILDIGGMERPTNPRTPLEKSAIENGRRCVSHRLLAAKRMNLL